MAKAAAKTARTARTGKVTGDTENPTATIPGEPMPEAPATRAAGLVQGAEYDTASGPQEVGATRGARRPVTETLRGARLPARAAVPVRGRAETEEQREAREEREAQAKEWADAQRDPKHKPTMVVATRTGDYGGKRRRRGAQFPMRIPKGWPLPSWVVEAPSQDRKEVTVEEVIEEQDNRDDDVLG